ncbi:hypothetical protein [Shewanella japonica]|nr:hypothetical protein [Shewanella japonica]
MTIHYCAYSLWRWFHYRHYLLLPFTIAMIDYYRQYQKNSG